MRPIQCAVSTQAQTQSASNDCFIDEARGYSLTQACNNYRPNQLEKGEKGTEQARNGEPLGEDLSYIYFQQDNTVLNHCGLGKVLPIHNTANVLYLHGVFQVGLTSWD